MSVLPRFAFCCQRPMKDMLTWFISDAGWRTPTLGQWVLWCCWRDRLCHPVWGQEWQWQIASWVLMWLRGLHWCLRSSVLGCGPAKGLLCPERDLFFFLALLVPPNRVICTLFFSFSFILSPDRVVAFLFHCGDLGHCFHYIIHNDNWA